MTTFDGVLALCCPDMQEQFLGKENKESFFVFFIQLSRQIKTKILPNNSVYVNYLWYICLFF